MTALQTANGIASASKPVASSKMSFRYGTQPNPIYSPWAKKFRSITSQV